MLLITQELKLINYDEKEDIIKMSSGSIFYNDNDDKKVKNHCLYLVKKDKEHFLGMYKTKETIKNMLEILCCDLADNSCAYFIFDADEKENENEI